MSTVYGLLLCIRQYREHRVPAGKSKIFFLRQLPIPRGPDQVRILLISMVLLINNSTQRLAEIGVISINGTQYPCHRAGLPLPIQSNPAAIKTLVFIRILERWVLNNRTVSFCCDILN